MTSNMRRHPKAVLELTLLAVLLVAVGVLAAVLPADGEPVAAAPAQATSTPAGYPYPQPATPTPTPLPPGFPTPVPTATVPGGGGGGGGPVPEVGTGLSSRVPQSVIDAAMANPQDVPGWNQLRNPNAPFHPVYNPYRTCLTLQNPNQAYHPVFNPVVFRAGCP
jgi:hypothetical protein